MSTVMATNILPDRRAVLRASRNRWSRTDNSEIDQIINSNKRNSDEDIVQRWLTSIPKDDAKPEVALETAMKPIRRNRSAEDDLALGVEASLYSKLSIRTVQSFQRSSVDPPSLSRLNSLASGFSIQSGASVMDVLNMLQDDPEELLLDLGFGIDEPDITERIPVRFLSYQSRARGMSLQLCLEAQQSRMDIENPDVRNRFRQLEVLQQVTTTFSSLVGSSSPVVDAASASQMSSEARERRKRMAMILRRASKKSLSQAQNQQALPPENSGQSGMESSGTPTADNRIPPKLSRQSLSDNNGLFPLQEEQSFNIESTEPILISHTTRGTSDPLKPAPNPLSTDGSTQQPVESFELEEIQSFDEGSVSGICSGPVDRGGERLGSNVTRTNSFQSDSSGFLEEPFIPALSQQNSPASELMKMLHAKSQDSTESQQRSPEQQNTERSTADKQNFGTQFGHTLNSRNTVLRTEDSGSINNTVDSHTVLRKVESRTDSTQMSKTLTEKAHSNSLSPDISQINGNGVCALVYSVQMDPICYPPQIFDKLHSLNQRVGKQQMSLFDELKSAETISSYRPTDLGTGVVEKEATIFADPHEVAEKDQTSGHSDQICDFLASNQDKNVTSNTAFGRDSPTALKRRRESFSKKFRSDVFTDNDSGTAQTPTTNTPFTSVETCSADMWNSMECTRGLGRFRTRSMSLDTALSYEEEDHRWEGVLWAGSRRCFHCGSQIGYDNRAKPQPDLSSNLPYSLDELEEMMRCMRKFRTVLTEIEARLEEEQASVLCSLSESHREEVEDVLRLREAVKQEAGMLEQQLSDLVHHYDDGIKMKLNRLLDEQSELCSQLRITPSEMPSPELPLTRTVGTQCCLLPATSSPQRCVHHHCTCHQRAPWHDPHRYQTQWEPNYKPDKLDFVAFIKSVRNALNPN